MRKTACNSWWGAVIQDMLQHISPAELKATLKERYPQLPELSSVVDEVSLRPKANIKSFCKRAQDFGFGYGNIGPTNYSVPNSEGAPGPGFGQLDPSNPSTPSSSYTDFAKTRLKKKKEQTDEEKRREKRKELVDKLAATKPGESITIGPDGVKPGESIEKIVEDVDEKIDTMNRANRSTEKAHEIAPQWSEQEQAAAEEAAGQTPATTTPGPGVKAPAQQTGPSKEVGDASKSMDDLKKKMKSTVDEGVKETKTLSDATKEMKNNIDTLNKSVTQLLG